MLHLIFIPVLWLVSRVSRDGGWCKLTGLGPGGFGPPACLATMI
jgi:hypothetical protein